LRKKKLASFFGLFEMKTVKVAIPVSGISSRFGLNSPNLEEFPNLCGGVLEAAVGGRDKNPEQKSILFRLCGRIFPVSVYVVITIGI
jgi:hypothetical protein